MEKINKVTFKGLSQVLKESFSKFGDDKITRQSGSLAYSTIFSLEPLLIVVISLCGIFLRKKRLKGKYMNSLKDFWESILQSNYRIL